MAPLKDFKMNQKQRVALGLTLPMIVAMIAGFLMGGMIGSKIHILLGPLFGFLSASLFWICYVTYDKLFPGKKFTNSVEFIFQRKDIYVPGQDIRNIPIDIVEDN